MYRPFSFECSSVGYKPHSTAVKIITPLCFYGIPPLHTQNAWLKGISIPGTRKLKPFSMLEFISCVWECVFSPISELMKSLQTDSGAATSCLTGNQLTRRLSVWEEGMLFQIRPNFGLSVCSGGHHSPKWNDIIQASPSLWLQWHFSLAIQNEIQATMLWNWQLGANIGKKIF